MRHRLLTSGLVAAHTRSRGRVRPVLTRGLGAVAGPAPSGVRWPRPSGDRRRVTAAVPRRCRPPTRGRRAGCPSSWSSAVQPRRGRRPHRAAGAHRPLARARVLRQHRHRRPRPPTTWPRAAPRATSTATWRRTGRPRCTTTATWSRPRPWPTTGRVSASTPPRSSPTRTGSRWWAATPTQPAAVARRRRVVVRHGIGAGRARPLSRGPAAAHGRQLPRLLGRRAGRQPRPRRPHGPQRGRCLPGLAPVPCPSCCSPSVPRQRRRPRPVAGLRPGVDRATPTSSTPGTRPSCAPRSRRASAGLTCDVAST